MDSRLCIGCEQCVFNWRCHKRDRIVLNDPCEFGYMTKKVGSGRLVEYLPYVDSWVFHCRMPLKLYLKE